LTVCAIESQYRIGIWLKIEHEPERWSREVAIVGGPETVAERIAALRAEFGFGSLQLVTGFLGNLPQEDVVRTLELFAKGELVEPISSW
jgi:alkanesulfonate monooxygenase SsuD/methylene tetrahydromethanopterin reductase-like flavin-dependent oxidoreductase (luciferase family)